MNIIDKKLLLNDMSVRLQALENRMLMDFTGSLQTDVFMIRELKYWKEAIERSEYDCKVWED